MGKFYTYIKVLILIALLYLILEKSKTKFVLTDGGFLVYIMALDLFNSWYKNRKKSSDETDRAVAVSALITNFYIIPLSMIFHSAIQSLIIFSCFFALSVYLIVLEYETKNE